MPLKYDPELFQSFRERAITKVEDLEIGKTYWSNWFNGPLILEGLMTDEEFRQFMNFTYSEVSDSTPKWMKFTNGETGSLNDHNIGNSYNPWLIFDNEETATECREQLEIDYDRDWVDDLDDYLLDDPNDAYYRWEE